MIFKDLLEKLNLPLVLLLYKKCGLHHDPTFVAYTNFDDGYERYIIYKCKASIKKKLSKKQHLKQSNIFELYITL